MRYIPQRVIDPYVYIGRTVNTTDNRTATVLDAWSERDGLVKLSVQDINNGERFFTDNEHATIKRVRPQQETAR